jgi:hypothetical protein
VAFSELARYLHVVLCMYIGADYRESDPGAWDWSGATERGPTWAPDSGYGAGVGPSRADLYLSHKPGVP